MATWTNQQRFTIQENTVNKQGLVAFQRFGVGLRAQTPEEIRVSNVLAGHLSGSG